MFVGKPATAAATIPVKKPANDRLIAFRLVASRVFKSIVTLFLVIGCSFMLLRFMPGNPVDAYIQNLVQNQGLSYEEASSRASAMLSFNPDAPLLLQFGEYLSGLARGDMGQSIVRPGLSVSEQVFANLPWTLLTVGIGTILSFAIGVIVGVFSAYRRGRALDHVATNTASVLSAVPNYIWTMLIIVVLGVQLRLFDVASMRGTLTPGVKVGFNFEFFGDALYHAAMPIAVYTLTGIGGWLLLMKSSTVQVLNEEYVTLADARGLSRLRIQFLYVGRSAVLPLISHFAIVIGAAFGGAVIVEQLFQYQGVGYYLYDSLTKRDYTMAQGYILIITVAVIVANLMADLLLPVLDPRLRRAGKAVAR